MNQRKPTAFVLPSTLRWLSERKNSPGYSLFDLLHGYVYARWPYLYIGMGTGEHPLAKKYHSLATAIGDIFGHSKKDRLDLLKATSGNSKATFAEGYHGKVLPVESAARLVMVQEEIRQPDLEQVIPYQRARAIILQNPGHIVALQCPCRSARQDPCLPLDVCLIVGEPFASFVLEHHPQRARWITQEQAVEIIRQEDARGHVHHAFFKDAMFGRFYAICNCCACCCGAMQFHRKGTPMLASSGFVCQIDDTLCIGCGECHDFCQFGALSLENSVSVVDGAVCMGCGVCVDKCAQGALSLERAVTRGIPLEISQLLMRSIILEQSN